MQRKSIFALALLGLTVSACGTQNRGLESVHQPVVSRTNYVIDVGTGYDGLAEGEAQRLNGWFESLKLGYGDRVAVDGGGRGASGEAREAIAAAAARYGLLLDDNAPIMPGELAPGSLRVVVSRTKANVPGCPDWSRNSGENFNQHSGANFGCGVNSNLAAMVANPEDLIQGRDSNGVTDSASATKAIKSYRERKPTGDQGLQQQGTRTQQ
jgi:pilus assembly protein CpaD